MMPPRTPSTGRRHARAALLLVGALTGCGGSSTPPAQTLTPLFEGTRVDTARAAAPGLMAQADAAREMLVVDGVPKREKQKKILGELSRRRSLLGLLGDAYKFWRAFR